MIRIETASTSTNQTRLTVQGQLVTDAVDLLQAEACQVRERGDHLQLDLRGEQFMDDEGVALVRRLCACGAVLQHASAFVRDLIDEPS